MLVSDLIDSLKKFPPDSKVLILYDDKEQEPNFEICNDFDSDYPIVRSCSLKYPNFVIHNTYLN